MPMNFHVTTSLIRFYFSSLQSAILSHFHQWSLVALTDEGQL